MSGISSKIMNLKFMQRHKNQVEQQQKAAADATKRLEAEWTMEQQAAGSSSSAAPSPAPPTRCGPATTAAAAAMPAARASPAAGATPPARRVVTVEDVQANEQQALLQFKPGRRSFGSFNPRLEKRLTEIEEHKREAAATMESERRAAEARKQQAAEHADLVRKAEKHEEAERQNSVSEAEMVARYAKYLPASLSQQPAATMPEPPVVHNPVRVRDAPTAGLGGGGGGGKKRKTGP
eukprot:Transcript_3226.p2 GENE.Transcript_3226~~Transcript_3226.p2  ORF type:complete len:236 (+),score=98.72 Transcript_3226:104-811(+)